MKAPTGHSKKTKANIVGLAAFGLGAFMRGFFADQWFGNLLGATIYAFGFMFWSHQLRVFCPESGSPEWEKFRRMGFLRYVATWGLGGLLMGLVMGPSGYIIRLIFDGPSRIPSFFPYAKFILLYWLCIGILMGLWAWIDCELIYRATRSKSSSGT